MGTSKQEYLFHARIADAGKSLQSFLRLGQWRLENRTQVAVELLKRNFGNRKKLFRTHVGEYASFADCCQSRGLSGENLVRACTDGSLENSERFGSTLVIRQIRNVLPND